MWITAKAIDVIHFPVTCLEYFLGFKAPKTHEKGRVKYSTGVLFMFKKTFKKHLLKIRPPESHMILAS